MKSTTNFASDLNPIYDETFLLQFIKDTDCCGTLYKKDDVISYTPWFYIWQNQSESERRENGIYIHCYGHGEFAKFIEGIDVKGIRVRPSLPIDYDSRSTDEKMQDCCDELKHQIGHLFDAVKELNLFIDKKRKNEPDS